MKESNITEKERKQQHRQKILTLFENGTTNPKLLQKNILCVPQNEACLHKGSKLSS